MAPERQDSHASSDDNYFFHVVPLEQLSAGCSTLVADRQYSDPEWLKAYQWLEREIGFYPLFLGAGNLEAAYLTGYQNQWRVNVGGELVEGEYVAKLRRAGEFPNFVLFAFHQQDLTGSFTDYPWWNIVLTDVLCDREIDANLRRKLFKKSWSRSRWLNEARRQSHAVQFLVPELNLRQAAFVWVRNEACARVLRNLGFTNVSIKRLLLENE